MFRIVCILIGYGIGCIQSSYFVGKAMHVDIRQHGSGNLGSTNALRVLGKKAGAITFACDVLKSLISFLICLHLFPSMGVVAALYGSVGAVLGHDFPFYLKFQGGKGIAAMLGMMLGIGGLPALISYGCGIIGLFSRYVSVGSMCFAAAIPFTFYFFGLPAEAVGIGAFLSLLAIWRHKANIIRLKNGNENRIGGRKDT